MSILSKKNVQVSTVEGDKPESQQKNVRPGIGPIIGMKIGNLHGKKWKVACDNNGKHLTLDGVGDKFSLERHKTEPVWRIHCILKGIKHSVSYRQELTSESNLVLESPQDDNRFYFHLYLQESGRLLIKPVSSPGSFIGLRDNLMRVVCGDKTEEDAFVIGVEVNTGDVQSNPTVKIQAATLSAGIISYQAMQDAQIAVGRSTSANAYDWEYSINQDWCTFQVPSSNVAFKSFPNLYITKVDTHLFTYCDPPSNIQLKTGNSGNKLKIGNEYVCINTVNNVSNLGVVSDEAAAAEWTLLVTALPSLIAEKRRKSRTGCFLM